MEKKSMDKKILGYARVSSYDQNEDRQILALKEMGVSETQIYVDKQSGKDFDRPQYKRLLRKLDENSVLVVKSIDRLGRNYAAENERVNIRQRQSEGIVAAKARGVKFGRPSVSLPDNFYEIHKQWKEKKLTLKQAAHACGLPKSTFFDKAKEIEKESEGLSGSAD